MTQFNLPKMEHFNLPSTTNFNLPKMAHFILPKIVRLNLRKLKHCSSSREFPKKYFPTNSTS